MRGFPIMSFNDNLPCETRVKGQQVKNSFKSINDISSERPLYTDILRSSWSYKN